jgi:large subunit ribosomal protein L9e
MDVYLASNDSKKFLKIDAHFAKREHAAILRTVCSHLANLISGVVTGIAYKMRTVYAHFPINLSIGNNGKGLEIRNFLGEKKVRVINLLGGVTCEHSNDVKEEILLKGTEIERVSRSAALICQSCRINKKDIRKFLDGIYVSEKCILKNITT